MVQRSMVEKTHRAHRTLQVECKVAGNSRRYICQDWVAKQYSVYPGQQNHVGIHAFAHHEICSSSGQFDLIGNSNFMRSCVKTEQGCRRGKASRERVTKSSSMLIRVDTNVWLQELETAASEMMYNVYDAFPT